MKFKNFESDSRRYVQPPKNNRYDSMYVIFRMKHGGRHYMLWGAFISKGASPLFEIHRNMNDSKHKNMLQDHLIHYWRKKFGRTNF